MSELIPVGPENVIWNYAIMHLMMSIYKISISKKNLVYTRHVLDTKNITDIKNKQNKKLVSAVKVPPIYSKKCGFHTWNW